MGNIPDNNYYRPLFSPWVDGGQGEFSKYYALAHPRTLVTVDRCWVLYSLLQNSFAIDGEVWECGVYKGGTAAMLAQIMASKNMSKILRLFDTYNGMPEVNPNVDLHHRGDFADVVEEEVLKYIGNAQIVRSHKGFMPDTFKGLEDCRLCFAHVDVDIYQSVLDCCGFIFPRLYIGGVMVFDDYGFPSCPGARLAVDTYFAGKGVFPLVIPTGQAIVFKNRELI